MDKNIMRHRRLAEKMLRNIIRHTRNDDHQNREWRQRLNCYLAEFESHINELRFLKLHPTISIDGSIEQFEYYTFDCRDENGRVSVELYFDHETEEKPRRFIARDILTITFHPPKHTIPEHRLC
jgi:hypothetical protein